MRLCRWSTKAGIHGLWRQEESSLLLRLPPSSKYTTRVQTCSFFQCTSIGYLFNFFSLADCNARLEVLSFLHHFLIQNNVDFVPWFVGCWWANTCHAPKGAHLEWWSHRQSHEERQEWTNGVRHAKSMYLLSFFQVFLKCFGAILHIFRKASHVREQQEIYACLNTVFYS